MQNANIIPPSHADECRNLPYQCNMQTLCLNMLLTDSKTLTQKRLDFGSNTSAP